MVRNTEEKKEEKREEDKIGKETRALQVVAIVRKTTDRIPSRKQEQI